MNFRWRLTAFSWKSGEFGGGADAGEEGALDGKPEGAQEVFVAEEDESESAAGATAEAQEHADFFQGWVWIVLGVVEDEDEGGGIEFGQVFFEDEEVGAALEARAFAEFGQEDFEDAGGGKRGLG